VETVLESVFKMALYPSKSQIDKKKPASWGLDNKYPGYTPDGLGGGILLIQPPTPRQQPRQMVVGNGKVVKIPKM
jgi:hypothetical protein